jgi:hypothetical protein
LQISTNSLTADVSLLSSIAVIIGAIFIVFQIRQNNRLIQAANEQAKAASAQAKLSTEQLKQNNELANMDLIMRLYEFANTAEFQSAWMTVQTTKINSMQEFEKLPKSDQLSFYQVAALFESLGVLVERGLVKVEVIDDTFLAELAWKIMSPFIEGMRIKFGGEEAYVFFEKLNNKLKERHAGEHQTTLTE